MTDERVFPDPVVVPLDELRDKLALVPIEVVSQVLASQGYRVVSSEALVIPPGDSVETLEALHRALDVAVALFIARARPSARLPLLTRTNVMQLVEWSHANLCAAKEAGGQ